MRLIWTGPEDAEMEEDQIGEYVLHSDHMAAIKQATDVIEAAGKLLADTYPDAGHYAGPSCAYCEKGPWPGEENEDFHAEDCLWGRLNKVFLAFREANP